MQYSFEISLMYLIENKNRITLLDSFNGNLIFYQSKCLKTMINKCEDIFIRKEFSIRNYRKN